MKSYLSIGKLSKNSSQFTLTGVFCACLQNTLHPLNHTAPKLVVNNYERLVCLDNIPLVL